LIYREVLKDFLSFEDSRDSLIDLSKFKGVAKISNASSFHLWFLEYDATIQK